MSGLTRRDLIVQGAAAAGALGLNASSSPAAIPADCTLRIATLGYALGSIPSITSRAAQEIGVRLLFEFADPSQMNRWVRQEPAAFDILDGFSYLIDPEWPTENLQPVEISRVQRWHQISRC